MPLLRESSIKKFAPKTIRLEDLYSHANNRSLPKSISNDIKKALRDAGVPDDKANMVLYNRKPLKVNEMKVLAKYLHQNKVAGFEKKDPKFLVESYVKHETNRKRNVARVRHENMLESRQEDKQNLPKPPGKAGGINNRVNLPF